MTFTMPDFAKTPCLHRDAATRWRTWALVPLLWLVGAHAVAQGNEVLQPAPCRGLDAEQNGSVVPAVGDTLTLARRPFVLRLQGAGFAAALHVARGPALADALAAAQRHLLWLSAGDVLASDPGDLLVEGRFALKSPGPRQTAFAAAFGDAAVRLLGSGAATVALPALAGEVPRQIFEHQDAAGVYRHPVSRIDAVPLERSTLPALHLVVFTGRQGYPNDQTAMFSRADWSACVLRFQP